jgi:hypothetical protein
MGLKQVVAGVQAAAAIVTSTPSTEPAQRAAEDYSSHQRAEYKQQETNTSAGIAANDADANTPAEHRPK